MIEIDLQKIRGTGRTKVKVERETGTTWEYRRTGKKEPTKKTSGRAGTGKLDKLPSNIKDTIIELRNLNYSGTQIKDNIETMLEATNHETRQKLIDANVITDTGSKLTVTPVAITQFAAKHGAKPTKIRGPKTAESVQAQEKAKHETTKGQLSEADKKIATLETELQAVKDRIEANRVDAANKQKVREKLRSDLRACHEELGS